MIGLTAAVYSYFQLTSWLGGPVGLLYEGRHLSLSVRRKITVNVFLFNVYKRLLFSSRFLRFLTFFILGERFFHLCRQRVVMC